MIGLAVGLTHLWVCLGFASERFKNAEPDEVAMTPFRYMRLVLIGLLTVIVLFPTSTMAAGCKLSTGIGQLALIERNIQSLGKALTGPDGKKIISGLRSQVSTLKRRGVGFPAKVRPILAACNALAPFYAKVKAAKQKAFLTMVLGGPNHYTGLDMREGHKHLVEKGLNDSHVDTVIKHLGDTLKELCAADEDITEVAAIANSVRDDVLNR